MAKDPKATSKKYPKTIQPGRYWVDIIDTQLHPGARLAFVAWIATNAGRVFVVKKESEGPLYTGAPRDWYLFDVKLPTEWDFKQGWSYPSKVRSAENPTAPVVTKSADTVPERKPRTITDEFGEGGAFEGMPSFAGLGSTALLLLAAYLLLK